ncbi:MAG: hypothetical protein P4L72_00885 [Parvibaculum sp.]|uniref:hypothetical protein n=1 Tax=Parvibaculum sp. TaxID=2024848 RepID=UPI0028424638|nr:hypothetical protein [Parvibaculum sp.]MDR3497760.1 hypothetical protein [Parvibaculum sp.]
MAVFLKFTAAATIAVALGLGSAYSILRAEAQRGAASATSENPYARAAYAARDFLPDARQP